MNKWCIARSLNHAPNPNAQSATSVPEIFCHKTDRNTDWHYEPLLDGLSNLIFVSTSCHIPDSRMLFRGASHCGSQAPSVTYIEHHNRHMKTWPSNLEVELVELKRAMSKDLNGINVTSLLHVRVCLIKTQDQLKFNSICMWSHGVSVRVRARRRTEEEIKTYEFH